MPFRRKTSKQLEEAGQSVEKSFSSPNISEFSQNPGGNRLETGPVTVQRKKSWLSRLLKPFRRSKSRTLTEPTEQPTSSCFPLQKSLSTFYTSPYSPLERAPSQKKNAEAKMESCESEDSESSDEKEEVPATSLTLIKPTLLAELKSSLKGREQSNGSESPEPMSDCPKPIKKRSIKIKSRPLSADSGLFSGDLRNLEQIRETHYDYPDRVFNEEETVSNNKMQPIKPRKKWNNIENQDFIKSKDFTYMEPQPIEPLHKFPKPRPPVNRRPSTRKGSRSAEDLAIPNHRRSEAELEDIIRKINEIPPPDVEPPMKDFSDIEIPIASVPPIPKKRTILPSPPTLQSQEQRQTIQTIDKTIDINNAQPSLTEQASLESTHFNQKIFKPELPPKTRKQPSRSNSLAGSKVSSPDQSISVYDTSKIFNEESINQEKLDIEPMKRVKTLPIRFHETNDIKESSNVFTSLLNSHQSQNQKIEIFKRSYALHSKDILQNNVTAMNKKSINKLHNKENDGEEANSPGKMIPEIRKDSCRRNKVISLSRESYMKEFENTMDNYLREIHTHEVNFNQKTPPNTPEQFEVPSELQDETLIEINKKESDSKPIESTKLSSENTKTKPPNSLEIKSNDLLHSCIITNDIYDSLSPLINLEETDRFLQEERSSSDHDMITPDDPYDSTKIVFGTIESSENSKENSPDISHKTETSKKSQIQETIMNLRKTTLTFQKPKIQAKPVEFVRKGAIRQKSNSSSDGHSSNHLKQTHYGVSKTEQTSSSSEQIEVSTKDSRLPKLYLNSEPINQEEEPETKRKRSKSLY